MSDRRSIFSESLDAWLDAQRGTLRASARQHYPGDERTEGESELAARITVPFHIDPPRLSCPEGDLRTRIIPPPDVPAGVPVDPSEQPRGHVVRAYLMIAGDVNLCVLDPGGVTEQGFDPYPMGRSLATGWIGQHEGQAWLYTDLSPVEAGRTALRWAQACSRKLRQLQVQLRVHWQAGLNSFVQNYWSELREQARERARDLARRERLLYADLSLALRDLEGPPLRINQDHPEPTRTTVPVPDVEESGPDLATALEAATPMEVSTP